jgi:4'-phosphopantetheinyl transferase
LFDLTDRSVHLWFLFPDAWEEPNLRQAAVPLLAEEERARMERFRFPKHRRLYLASRLLLRTTLSRYADLPPQGWRFVSGEKGKPRLDKSLAGSPSLGFNLSHTLGVAVVGVTKKGTIGVDVEQADRPARAGELVKRFFSLEEKTVLEKLPPGRLQTLFGRYWTLKEAYVKALGRGLSHPLDSFSFSLSEEEPHRIVFSGEGRAGPETWRFALIAPRPKIVAALAVSSIGIGAPLVVRCFLMLPAGDAEPLAGETLGLSAGVVHERGDAASGREDS